MTVNTSLVQPGWWDANVRPDANPIEVVEIVEQKMPTHPALPELRRIAESFKRAAGQEERAFIKCPTCRDIRWVFVGRNTVKPCVCSLAGGVNFRVPEEKKQRREYGR